MKVKSEKWILWLHCYLKYPQVCIYVGIHVYLCKQLSFIQQYLLALNYMPDL